MQDRQPGRGRYAHLEREQRWLASRVPSDSTPVASIVDRYIRGTRLRLRRSESADGTLYKLGQKVRDDPDSPVAVRLTNMYLSEAEYDALLGLPAAELRKTRTRVGWNDHSIGVDRFHGRHDGLLLSECELTADEPFLPLPPWATRDVSDDDRFSGGALAFATDEEIAVLLG